ncbi:MAG: biotin/lipoyl-binding protein [bacterium]|nr:biotin/lipoyl-binding protein [bacterium]
MKKKYILNVDDEQYGALVAQQGDDTEIAIDNGPLHPMNHWPVLQGKAMSIHHAGRMHLVHVTGLDNKGNVAVTLNGRPIKMTVMDELRAQALESLGDSVGSGTINADIPGLIVNIKVHEGQVVHQGDPIIVVEAMKMQNELCAAVGGTVTSIPVEVNQAVNPGDVLVVIDPEPGG